MLLICHSHYWWLIPNTHAQYCKEYCSEKERCRSQIILGKEHTFILNFQRETIILSRKSDFGRCDIVIYKTNVYLVFHITKTLFFIYFWSSPRSQNPSSQNSWNFLSVESDQGKYLRMGTSSQLCDWIWEAFNPTLRSPRRQEGLEIEFNGQWFNQSCLCKDGFQRASKLVNAWRNQENGLPGKSKLSHMDPPWVLTWPRLSASFPALFLTSSSSQIM